MDTIDVKNRTVCIPHGRLVTIKDDRTGYQYPAAMHKDCREGMFIEANYAPRPGSTFHILFDNREGGSRPSPCAAVVRWRKPLCRIDSTWSYGLGIKLV
jgi:hypothetical protein